MAEAKPSPSDAETQALLDQGVGYHQAGRLEEAESTYRKILQTRPDHADANHLLGVIALQVSEFDVAIELISKAITANPDVADYHNNLGLCHANAGRSGDAEDHYRRALQLRPGYTDAENNLANALAELGRRREAEESYRRALELSPDFANGHYNLGNLVLADSRFDEAEKHYRRALELDPGFAEVHNNLGLMLHDQGRLIEAGASLREALALAPRAAEAHANLGAVLLAQGETNDAFQSYRTAVNCEPGNERFLAAWAGCLEAVSFTTIDDSLHADLLRALRLSTVSPKAICAAVISALSHHPEISALLAQPAAAMETAARLSGIPLLLRIMALSPIPDVAMERLLTDQRGLLVDAAASGDRCTEVLGFAAALALHGFTNEYAFTETVEEAAAVEQLADTVAERLQSGNDVPPAWIAILGAYRPLYGFEWADRLAKGRWPEEVAEVIRRQIEEVTDERSLRSEIASLTPIEDEISRAVRGQYEENPYPRWIKTTVCEEAWPVERVLQNIGIRMDWSVHPASENPEILIAGCGSGQHALDTATRFAGARVLAVDLSLSSLAYALRKTRELGVTNIDYGQADILELGGLDRQFHIIESMGVLHHLGDPLAGWRVLADLLAPGGLMKIGLYSDLARRSNDAAQALIAEKGYGKSREDIRRFRQEAMALAHDGDAAMAKVVDSADFYSLSECRDLLFHVQEHRFTLPEIETALETLGLEFLGFELSDRAVMGQFREQNPGPDAASSLPAWHQFETENPDTFAGMYQFWSRKV